MWQCAAQGLEYVKLNKQLKIAEFGLLSSGSRTVVFDRARLAESTMDDPILQQEILTLFIDQLARIDAADWLKLDRNFEMHALRGSASAVGAEQIDHICGHWQNFGDQLEGQLKMAIAAFCIEAVRR